MKRLDLLAVLLAGAALQHHCGTALRAQSEVSKPISGTITGFNVKALTIEVKEDAGELRSFPIGPETQVMQVPPGQRDLSHAKAARLTDLARGDRILVSFVSGLTEARRIVWISATDIAARNAAERLDWQRRGISGTVAAVDGNEIALEIRSPQGTETSILSVAPTTVFRRYAPGSVSFVDALPSTIDAISKGDQLRARGDRSGDGRRLKAEDIVFGTFLTKVGTIASIDAEGRAIRIEDATTQHDLTVRLTANSLIKLLPDRKMMFAAMLNGRPHEAHERPPSDGVFDFAKMIAQLPAGRIEDLKAATTVIVTSTSGGRPDEITAILLLANADDLIQMARMQAGGGEGMSASQALSTLHGGMLAGPGGLTIPTIIP